MMQVHFASKDSVLARHYHDIFAEEFVDQAQLWPQLSEMEREGLMAAWKLAMFQEARLQEHYDYVEHEGKRALIYEVYALGNLRVSTKIPKLLIPEVTVAEVS